MIKRLAHRLFRWYCHPDFYPDISGDLEELYLRNKTQRPLTADVKYFLQVMLLFRPALMRSFFKNSIFNDTGMLKNYFKLSVRNLGRQKAYTFINVLGLAMGLSAFLLIQEYVGFERSYDRFHADAGQLYRLTTDQVVEGVTGARDAMSFAPSGKVLKDEIPEISHYATTYKFPELIFKKGDAPVIERMVVAADEHFLELFNYPALRGDPATMLAEPNSLVLSASKARFYFGDEDPLGKTVRLMGSFNQDFKVTGVLADPRQNTHYKFDMLMSISSIKERMNEEAWNAYNYYTFVKMNENADMAKIHAMLPALTKKYLNQETSLVFHLQPVAEIHLHSDFTFEPEIHGSAKAVNFLALISFFILVIAWVNYINLSTARAIDRAKEVGIRKVVGASKKQLITQFIFEALLINLLGAMFAFGLAELCLPVFNTLVSKEILDHTWNSADFLQKMGLFMLLGTVISGVYPALVLSGFSPVMVLKGKFRNSRRGAILRKGLVVVQFASSLVLIASTLIVYQQVNYMRSKDKGMNIDQVVGFRFPRVRDNEREAHFQQRLLFAEALTANPVVKSVALTGTMPGGGNADISSTSGVVQIIGKTDVLDVTTYLMNMDDKVLEVLEMEVLYGRNFDRTMASDTNAVLVNEAFVRRFGIAATEDLLNEKMKLGRGDDATTHPIIGIVKDTNRSSLKNGVEPTIYFYNKFANYTIAKLDAVGYKEGLTHIQATWAGFFPETPLAYTFLDERFESLYQEDKKFGAVFGVFSVLALLVGTLGLFGLSSFMAIQRTKEVGVRKVLGASVGHIVTIFYKDFLLLLVLAFVVGMPLIYLGMEQWLNSYAYRISFPWFVPVVSFVAVLLVALVTVGYQVYKVAVLDPARTLRYE